MPRSFRLLAPALALAMLLLPSAADAQMRQIGVPAGKPEDYKPIVGRHGGRIVFTMLGEPKSFNPITAGETSTTQFTASMFQGLVETDPFTGETVPLLAEKWEVADDGLTWTFHLRKGVVFNDGTPFTARDVVFTWNDLIYDLSRPDLSKPARWPCSMRDIATFEGKQVKVELVDEHTVRFITPVKLAIAPSLLGAQEILSEAKYRPLVASGEFGGGLSANAKPEDLVGTGPFILGTYVRGERVVLKRNPRFWKQDAEGKALPYLDELVYLRVGDLNQMLLLFRRGETDSFAIPSGKELADLLPRRNEGNFTVYQLGPDFGTNFLAFNMNSEAGRAGKVDLHKVEWFRDRRFREAVSLAIDRNALIRNVLRNVGHSLPAPFTLAPGPFRQEGFAPRQRDLAKAREMLRDMGLFDRNGDGIIEDAQGRKVAFTLNTNSGNNVREEFANFIGKDLRDLGMEVNVQFLEFNLLVDKMDVSYNWEAMVMGFTGGTEPHFGANFWFSNARLHLWWPEQKQPSFDWEKRIDEIFAAGIQELDATKRKALYREWIELVYNEQPVIYLTTGERLTALRNRFGNIFPAPIGGVLHNIEEIFVLNP